MWLLAAAPKERLSAALRSTVDLPKTVEVSRSSAASLVANARAAQHFTLEPRAPVGIGASRMVERI
jgi:hypothetical protein